MRNLINDIILTDEFNFNIYSSNFNDKYLKVSYNLKLYSYYEELFNNYKIKLTDKHFKYILLITLLYITAKEKHLNEQKYVFIPCRVFGKDSYILNDLEFTNVISVNHHYYNGDNSFTKSYKLITYPTESFAIRYKRTYKIRLNKDLKLLLIKREFNNNIIIDDKTSLMNSINKCKNNDVFCPYSNTEININSFEDRYKYLYWSKCIKNSILLKQMNLDKFDSFDVKLVNERYYGLFQRIPKKLRQYVMFKGSPVNIELFDIKSGFFMLFAKILENYVTPENKEEIIKFQNLVYYNDIYDVVRKYDGKYFLRTTIKQLMQQYRNTYEYRLSYHKFNNTGIIHVDNFFKENFPEIRKILFNYSKIKSETTGKNVKALQYDYYKIERKIITDLILKIENESKLEPELFSIHDAIWCTDTTYEHILEHNIDINKMFLNILNLKYVDYSRNL